MDHSSNPHVPIECFLKNNIASIWLLATIWDLAMISAWPLLSVALLGGSREFFIVFSKAPRWKFPLLKKFRKNSRFLYQVSVIPEKFRIPGKWQKNPMAEKRRNQPCDHLKNFKLKYDEVSYECCQAIPINTTKNDNLRT